MRSRPILAVAVLALFLTSVRARADAGAIAVPATESVRLPNGLRVLLAPDPEARLVSVRVSYHVGRADDPSGLGGLAHMTEHLVAERARHIPSAFLALESWGATGFNAGTELDSTSYFETVPPERLDAVLWLESDRMGFAADAITADRVRSQRATIKNEHVQNSTDAALGSVDELRMSELFPAWHPYGTASESGDVDSVSMADVQAFLATWYGPANATLSIAGRFDRDAVIASVSRYFAPLPSKPPPARPPLPAWDAPSVRLVVKAAIPANQVAIDWRTPAYGSKDDAALDLVATALAGAGNERLTRALLAPRLATAISSRQQSFLDASVFHVFATVAPGVDPAQVIAVIEQTVAELVRTAGPAEIARARALRLHALQSALEATSSRAYSLASLAALGFDAGPSFDWGLGRYRAVEDADVVRAASKWLLHGSRLVTAIFANSSAPSRGELVGRDEIGDIAQVAQ